MLIYAVISGRILAFLDSLGLSSSSLVLSDSLLCSFVSDSGSESLCGFLRFVTTGALLDLGFLFVVLLFFSFNFFCCCFSFFASSSGVERNHFPTAHCCKIIRDLYVYETLTMRFFSHNNSQILN